MARELLVARKKIKEARDIFGQLATLEADELHDVWSIAADGVSVLEPYASTGGLE